MGRSELQLHRQDRALVDLELGLFAVFDGLGGVPGSERAAELASALMPGLCRRLPGPPLERLAGALEALSAQIQRARLGATTAVVLWVVGPVAWWISVGDSRLYLLRQGALTQLTKDQGLGNLVDSALGFPEPKGSLTRQRGSLSLRPRDRLALVTDGVTGDFPPDILSSAELVAALSKGPVQAAAEELVRRARKRDDRTALVMDWLATAPRPRRAPTAGGAAATPPADGGGAAPPAR